ncbi:hypothetical protein AVEN_28170-1 [Araneus ventricosus]|uniref:Peptidase M1 membrane alanine aminopeptidase domain-containing protein n=1 Tax=Araneus ventricosus TaxID=182803 RepID=A0A4Y2QNB4_ARAVE|nr:hypothetical protein AVEN_28170-1 [Araneus ventricosus]
MLYITQLGYQEMAGNYSYTAIFGCLEELSKKIPAEDESDALYLNGEVTEYSDQVPDSGTEVNFIQRKPKNIDELRDMIAIPDFSSGAMEHWGLITYRETNLLYDPEKGSPQNMQRIADVIAHEMTHMSSSEESSILTIPGLTPFGVPSPTPVQRL